MHGWDRLSGPPSSVVGMYWRGKLTANRSVIKRHDECVKEWNRLREELCHTS